MKPQLSVRMKPHTSVGMTTKTKKKKSNKKKVEEIVEDDYSRSDSY